jgi:L-lactate utilization protein LutC
MANTTTEKQANSTNETEAVPVVNECVGACDRSAHF